MSKLLQATNNDNLTQDSQANKINFIKIIGIAGVVVIGGYSAYNYIIKDYPYAIMETILAFLLIYSLFLVQKNEIERSTNIGAFVLAYITLHNFSTGGFSETGMLWTFMFPSLIFVIQGRRKGLIWNIILYSFIIIMIVGHIFYNFPRLPYSDFTLANLIAILAIISAISYSKQLILEKDQDFLAESARKEKLANISLAKSIEDLQSRSEDLEKLNKFMTGREIKMIELKKRIEEMEGLNENKK